MEGSQKKTTQEQHTEAFWKVHTQLQMLMDVNGKEVWHQMITRKGEGKGEKKTLAINIKNTLDQ